jgi:hypothetical protein
MADLFLYRPCMDLKDLSYCLGTDDLTSLMSKVQKIDVKMTFKMTDEERENFRNDTPIANKLLNRKPDDEISKSTVVRAAVWNLHQSIQQGVVPKWLKDYLDTKPPAQPKSKTKPKRPKK